MPRRLAVVMENFRKTLESAGCGLDDVVGATRYLATHARCQVEISAIAVTDGTVKARPRVRRPPSKPRQARRPA